MADSASGLCDTCYKALETERRSADATATRPLSEFGTRPWNGKARPESHDFDIDTETLGRDRKARHRSVPAGFEFISHLGGGGMGDVFLARETVADRLVAVKFLRHVDPQSIKRFEKEIRALAKLDHPNIVRFYSVDVDRPDPFFTMEYSPGGSLADKIRVEGVMSPDAAADTALALSRAVEASHGRQILHRDIKPGNVLFDANGTPKLSDFGLAKSLDDEGDTQTMASRAVGTPPFMPPEAVSRRHGEFGESTDVYGLGATLFFMLTGQPPFTGESHDVMNMVVRDAPPRPRSLRPEIPLGLEACVLKCLEKKPEDRYASSAELAHDLNRCRTGETPTAPAMTRMRRARRWAARNRVLVGSVFAAALLIVGIVAAWRTPDPAKEIRAELQRGRTVELLGDRGTPRYHRWALGSATFGQATNGSPACYYETMGMGLLELCPAPGIDRYRIVLDMLQLEAHAGDEPGKAQPLRYLGPYFGYSPATTADGRPVHWYFAAAYSDIRPNAETPDRKPTHLLRPLSVATSLDFKRDPNPHRSTVGKPTEFPGAGGTAGLWRTFQIDVAPEAVRIAWKREDEKEFTHVLELTPPAIQSSYEEPRPSLERNESTTIAAPTWSANSPFGIWTQRTGVCIRNVRIIPVPKPL